MDLEKKNLSDFFADRRGGKVPTSYRLYITVRNICGKSLEDPKILAGVIY